MRTLVVVSCALFAGCSAGLTPSKIEPPASVLLQPPKPLAAPKGGDDAIKLLVETRRSYAGVADRHRRLQRYVRTVLGKR